jgi:Cyclic nucleotide-binding domain
MSLQELLPYLAGVGLGLMLIGFLFRNPLKLRSFVVLGSLVFMLYSFLLTPLPWWTAIMSAVAIIAVNVFMIWQTTTDHRKFRLSAEEMMLFARLPGLTPGQYKELLNISEWHSPKVSMQLTKLGSLPNALYYVLEGQVEVNRSGGRFSIGPHAFIGELAFLRAKPATATTFANVGSLIVSWEHSALRALMKSNDGVRKSIDNLLSVDMAEKIARNAAPILQEQAG